MEDYNRAIEINSKYADAYYNRGFTRIFSNDKTGGCSDFNMAKKLGSTEANVPIRKYCQ